MNGFRTTEGYPAVLLPIVLSLLLLVPSAFGQAQSDEEERPAATHARWGVGVQLMPVLGGSVRWAVTRWGTLQVGAMPGLGGNFQGAIGGRALFKFVIRERYNVYGSVGGTSLFDESLQFDDDLRLRRQVDVLWYLAASIGAEFALGTQFGLSGEAGGGQMRGAEETLTFPAVGVGLHYYW